MSMLDSFFNKGFKAGKCKTLLKLTIPRIKLMRNRREIQTKQMRRDIAKLLETGQEATARIRVEHVIREENMMNAQEILELFCELVSVRLPIIEIQSECPLDLKEAISSICFAAPRCADLPELLQVQILFGAKYGREFIAAATELMPECGVNRQLIDLLSVRAPSPHLKLKLLKEIAKEHELAWDPEPSETELLKKHDDLLNGPTQFSGSKSTAMEEKHEEALNSVSDHVNDKQPDSDFETLDFPEVPKVSLRSSANAASGPEMSPVPSVALHGIKHESSNLSATSENLSQEPYLENDYVTIEKPVDFKDEKANVTVGATEDKQFLPFISRPPASSTLFCTRPSSSSPVSSTKKEANSDLQDVIAAAQVAAETAEHAAAAARSAATLAQARISGLTQKSTVKFPENGDENPFHADIPGQSATPKKHYFDHQHSFDSMNGDSDYLRFFENLKVEHDSPSSGVRSVHHQPQRLPSVDDEPYFSYPNLFTSQNSNLGPSAQPSTGNSRFNPHDI